MIAAKNFKKDSLGKIVKNEVGRLEGSARGRWGGIKIEGLVRELEEGGRGKNRD